MLNFLRAYWITVLAAIVLVGGTIYLRWTEPRPGPPPDARFELIGPQGEPLTVQLPELAKAPPLDLAAACALVARQNAALRAADKTFAASPPGFDTNGYIRVAAEDACADASRRDYSFYDALGDALNAPTQSSRDNAYQLIAALREALRSARTADEVVATLKALSVRTSTQADRLHEPDLFLLGAEAMAAAVHYCGREEGEAAGCRASANMTRGENLFDAGRWRADTRLLYASIAAHRDALRDTPDRSDDWVELHARIGSALAQLSERESGAARRTLLRQALDEYELAASAVDPESRWTWAMINQNICSIREPLATLDMDRANIRRSIEECEKARAHYAEYGDKTSEAAAHYNMSGAFEKLADWDQDETAALAAVEHARRAVGLYAESGVTLSVAFGQVKFARTLIDASAFASSRPDEESRAKSRALLAEARASLDAAEPILRSAKATGYLQSLTYVRSRLEQAR